MDYSERIDKVFRLQPEATAIEFRGRQFPWRQLATVRDDLDAALTGAGLGAGAAIGVLLRNRPAHIGAVLALHATRRCLVTLNAYASVEHVCEDLRELRLAALVADDEDWAKPALSEWAREASAVAIVLTQTPELRVSVLAGLESPGQGRYRQPMPGIAIEMLTSGTTGRPKRVPLAYATFEDAISEGASAEAKRGELQLKTAPAIMYAPLVHVGGVFALGLAIYEARPIVLLEKFELNEWLAAVRRNRPKFASLVPAIVREIYAANVAKEDLQSLLAIRAGTAPLDLETRRLFEERYGVPVLVTYGATEFAGAVTRWSLPEYKKTRDSKFASVGKACPGFELRVVHRDTFEPLPPGEIGILEIKAERTGSADRWTRTTDIASIDADGYLYVHGRSDDAIIRGGFKVLPDMVADVFRGHPAVRDVAVVALKDARLGEIPGAAVEVKQGFQHPSEADLEAFGRERLVAYQVPARWLIVDELPRTTSLKIKLGEVKEMFARKANA